MPATEDSVLTSLNELRRLRKERRKKGRSSRSAGGNSGSHKPAAAAAYDPMGDQVTPPPQTDLGMPVRGGRAGLHAAQAARPALSMAAPVAATWDAPADPVALVRMAQPKSSAKPAIVVAIVLLAAGGLGYMKLQNDTQSLLDEKNANIRRVEDARAQAVEAAALAQRQVQDKLKACEARVQASAAAPATTATAAVAPAATAAVAPAPSAVSTPARSRGRHRSSGGRRTAAVAAPAASAQPSAVPQLPHKKKLDNDPLAGIKI